MQVNRFSENRNDTAFGARKIMTAVKIVKDNMPYEKLDVYKLDAEDICDENFLRRVAKFMDSRWKMLNESQRKMLSQMKNFISEYQKVWMIPFTEDASHLYLGVKNDETITGVMTTRSSYSRSLNRLHSIEDINVVEKDGITEDSFVYSLLADKSMRDDIISNSKSPRKFSSFGKSSERAKIRDLHPDYKMNSAAQSELHDLEEVFGIEEL